MGKHPPGQFISHCSVSRSSPWQGWPLKAGAVQARPRLLLAWLHVPKQGLHSPHSSHMPLTEWTYMVRVCNYKSPTHRDNSLLCSLLSVSTLLCTVLLPVEVVCNFAVSSSFPNHMLQCRRSKSSMHPMIHQLGGLLELLWTNR